MIRLKLLLRCLLIPLAAGLAGSLLGGGMRALYALYPKPPFSPPGLVFPIVWTALYLAMGVSDYLCRTGADTPLRRQVYSVQLALSAL